MKKQQQELRVIVHGELDITKMPKDILDAFIDALIEEVEKMMKEDKEIVRREKCCILSL